MTDEEIEEAIQSAILNAETVDYDRSCTPKDHADTVAEIADLERLGAFAKAAREIVQAVANGPADSSTYLCNYCDEYIGGIFGQTTHKPDCPVTMAHAILEK